MHSHLAFLNNVSTSVRWTFVGIYVVLIAITVSTHLYGRVRAARGPRYFDILQRIETWWVIITLFAISIFASRTATLVFFGFVSFLALKEFLSMIPTRRADRRVLFWAYIAIPLQYYWIAIGWYGMFIIFIPIFIFLFLPVRMVTIGETTGFLKAAGTVHWGLMTTVFSIGHIGYLMMLPGYKNPSGGNAGYIVFLVLLTEFNDVAQFCWGKLFGKTLIVPNVSKSKTLEGLLGGVLSTMTLSYLVASFLTPLSVRQSLFVGCIISLSGFFGDVVIRAIKRDLGLSERGRMLPGHGGILDRVDSLTYTAPLFFHYIYFYFG